MENGDLTWKKISEEKHKFGYRKLLKRTFILPYGEIANFDLYASEPAVCVLALTTDKKVILTKQFRPAQERILIELPGGGLKPEEKPIDAISRELLEETGYKGKVEFVCTSLQSAYDTLVRHNFIATDCEQVEIPQLEENNESVEVTYMTIDEFKTHLKSGNLTDVATGYLGLDYLGLL